MRLLHVIVAGLLLALLPVQGASALAMCHCVSPQMEQAGALSDAAGSIVVVPPDIGMEHHDVVSVRVLDTSPSADAHAPSSQGDFTCAPGAPCCAGAFIVNSAETPVLPAVPMGETIPHPSVRYSDHTPERLERPPHTSLV